MEHSTERPAVVGWQPVELGGGQLLRPLLNEAGRLVDSPEPSVEVGGAERKPVVRQGHCRRNPAVGRRRLDAAALPGEPLVDLVQMIERMIEDAAKDLPRRVGVAGHTRRGQRRRPRVGQAREQLVRHERWDLARGVVHGEPREMLTRARVRFSEMSSRIAGSRRHRVRPGDSKRRWPARSRRHRRSWREFSSAI